MAVLLYSTVLLLYRICPSALSTVGKLTNHFKKSMKVSRLEVQRAKLHETLPSHVATVAGVASPTTVARKAQDEVE